MGLSLVVSESSGSELATSPGGSSDRLLSPRCEVQLNPPAAKYSLSHVAPPGLLLSWSVPRAGAR